MKEEYKPLTKEDGEDWARFSPFLAYDEKSILSAREGLKDSLHKDFCDCGACNYRKDKYSCESFELLCKFIDKWFNIGAGEKRK